jgi:hypothetical protein
MITKILERAIQLNCHYGKGNVTGLQMDDDSNGGTITIVPYLCKPETRRFRFHWSTHTLHLFNRQSVVTSRCCDRGRPSAAD